jgi:hypothetical protein
MHPKNPQMSNNGKNESCPDCGEKITISNPRIGEHEGGDMYGNCVSCYDPTPKYSGDGGSAHTGYEFRYGPNS